MRLKKAWRIWAKTIGSKIGDNHESDIAAIFSYSFGRLFFYHRS